LLDRAEWVFDRLAVLVEDVRMLRDAGLHSVQYGLVFETGHGSELVARALRAVSLRGYRRILRVSSISFSRTWASRRSRTLRGRCGRIEFA
jgi:hypothetical protein